MTTGMNGVEAIRNLESKKVDVTLYNVRMLEKLQTPESREEVLSVMRDDKVTLPLLEKAVPAAVHKMWCHWYWIRSDFIHPDKGVLSQITNPPVIHFC